MIKIKPHEIAFDIDGVVADTMSSFIYVAKKEFGIEGIEREQITDYWLEKCLDIPEKIIDSIIKRLLEDPFGTALKPMDGATDVLSALADKSNLLFVTARPARGPIEKWLTHALQHIDCEKIEIIATGQHEAKVEILKDRGIKYFVEDHLETCIQLVRAGINAIVFDHPWNQGETPFLRVKNWKELKGFLQINEFR